MRLISLTLLLAINMFSLATAEEIDARPVRAGVARAVRWLEKDMVTWRENNGCAACHHGPMYVWSSHVVRRQKYEINERQLQDFTHWVIEEDSSRVFPKTTPAQLLAGDAADRMTANMMGHNNLSQPTLYLAHALNALPAEDPLAAAGWQRLRQHWKSAQMDDGSFAGRKGWQPIFNSPQILTLFAAIALQDRLGMKSDDRELVMSLEQLQKRAAGYLDGQKPDVTHQGIILRLLLQSERGDKQDLLLKTCFDCNATTAAGPKRPIVPAMRLPRDRPCTHSIASVFHFERGPSLKA